MSQRIRRRDVEQHSLVEDDDDEDDSIISMHDDVDSKVPHSHRACWLGQFLILFSLLVGLTTYLCLEWLIHEDAVSATTTRNATTLVDGFVCPVNLPGEGEYAKAVQESNSDPNHAFSHLSKNVSYQDVKEAMRQFVADYIVPHLSKHNNNGQNIALYEASCGEGWNLWLTLELLQEIDSTIQPVVVYGNDPDATSVASANAMLLQKQQELQAYSDNNSLAFSMGTICQAESTNLSHVPSYSFDMVFTGRLQLLKDPLELTKDEMTDSEQQKQVNEHYHQVCDAILNINENIDNTWMENKLYAILQQRQDEWVGQWVAEMARIAKPGAPIILEHVSSKSFCESLEISNDDNSGGVDRSFWKIHAEQNTYGWDVHPESIVIQTDDDRIDASRYHVFMLKKKGQ